MDERRKPLVADTSPIIIGDSSTTLRGEKDALTGKFICIRNTKFHIRRNPAVTSTVAIATVGGKAVTAPWSLTLTSDTAPFFSVTLFSTDNLTVEVAVEGADFDVLVRVTTAPAQTDLIVSGGKLASAILTTGGATTALDVTQQITIPITQ